MAQKTAGNKRGAGGVATSKPPKHKKPGKTTPSASAKRPKPKPAKTRPAKQSRRQPAKTRLPGSMVALRNALTQSEARFHSLVETSAAPILLLSADLTVREMNSEAEFLYGRTRDKVVGKDYFAAQDPGQQGAISRDDLDQMLQGQPVRSATPPPTVPGLIADLAARGCRAAVVITADSSETD